MGDPKKLNGRPPLQDGKRNKFINVRFTEEEYNEVMALEKQLGLTRAELIRVRILSGSRQTVVNARDLIARLDTIGTEMNRIGNNINQLARHANTMRLKGSLHQQVVVEFNALFEEYIRTQQGLDLAIRKIIRAMGN